MKYFYIRDSPASAEKLHIVSYFAWHSFIILKPDTVAELFFIFLNCFVDKWFQALVALNTRLGYIIYIFMIIKLQRKMFMPYFLLPADFKYTPFITLKSVANFRFGH